MLKGLIFLLFDDHCDIYFNIIDDKGTQLKLNKQLDFEQETLISSKKEQPEHKCSDCYHLADSGNCILTLLISM